MTPTYAFVMFTWFFLLPYMGEGPLWYVRSEVERDRCERYWWASMLYISNLVPPFFSESCMGWGWYLSADFQLYLFIPVFVLPLAMPRFNRNAKISVIALGLVVGIALTLGMTAGYNISALPFPEQDTPFTNLQDLVNEWQRIFYGKPYPRLVLTIVAICSAFGARFVAGSKKERRRDCLSWIPLNLC